MKAVICKQRLLHEKEIVQYFQNYKCYGVGQDNLRKDLYSCTKFKKKSDLETALINFKGYLILGYF